MGIKEAVADCLTEMPGQFCSGEALAQKLGVSRNAVWKAIRQLQEEGFPITSKKKNGYCLSADADILTEQEIRRFSRSKVLGNRFYVLPQVDSTNQYCRQLAREGAVHGTVVTANQQTAGKGRQGRSFCSPPGTGLYFSVLLAQDLLLQDAPMLTACAAVAASRAIDGLYGTRMQIKWVNDLFLQGKKCCGILTEGAVSLESGKLEHAVVGIGINLRNTESFPEELRCKVTPLEEAVPGCHVRRAELLAAILWELEQVLRELPERRFLPEYRNRSCLLGKTAMIQQSDGTQKKVAVLEIAEDCGLVVRDSFGNMETLHSGDVHIVGF